ncbi:hypothetical protein [Saccharopolyspora pogona]|uniref:hypothetical protein n=1 Tax=Saccharopolyspora pogona TaxID=333966 RepID=UPI001687F00A|nr:hypothetical protein [Saccharopolyspora pogona]
MTWSGDLADELADLPTKRRFTLPKITVPDAPMLADEKAVEAERAVAKHVAYSRPPVTRRLLADALAGSQRL